MTNKTKNALTLLVLSLIAIILFTAFIVGHFNFLTLSMGDRTIMVVAFIAINVLGNALMSDLDL